MQHLRIVVLSRAKANSYPTSLLNNETIENAPPRPPKVACQQLARGPSIDRRSYQAQRRHRMPVGFSAEKNAKMEVVESKKNIIQGDALELIRHGRFGPISIGSSIAEVREFLSPIEGLEPEPLSTYDPNVEDTCVFVFECLRFYLKKKHGEEFKVSGIVVDALTEDEGFLDYDENIFFKCHGFRRKIKIEKIKRRLNNIGIDIIDQKTVAFWVELRTHPSCALILTFYEPEGIVEAKATLSKFELK